MNNIASHTTFITQAAFGGHIIYSKYFFCNSKHKTYFSEPLIVARSNLIYIIRNEYFYVYYFYFTVYEWHCFFLLRTFVWDLVYIANVPGEEKYNELFKSNFHRLWNTFVIFTSSVLLNRSVFIFKCRFFNILKRF